MIWPLFGSRAYSHSSFYSWVWALTNLAVMNECSSFVLIRCITSMYACCLYPGLTAFIQLTTNIDIPFETLWHPVIFSVGVVLHPWGVAVSSAGRPAWLGCQLQRSGRFPPCDVPCWPPPRSAAHGTRFLPPMPVTKEDIYVNGLVQDCSISSV